MIRKMLVIAAAVAIPVGVIGATGGLATAAGSKTAGTDTAACKTITGTVTFSPKLTKAGYKSGHISTKITATLTGCTAAGATKETLKSGAVSGTIVGATGTASKPTGTCTGLAGNSVDTGTLDIKWTATPAISESALGIKSVSGGAVGSGSSAHGTFTIPGTTKGTASGSFLGSNKGASDKSIAETVESPTTILNTCDKSGLSSIKIQTETGKTAVSLS
jgi:hypothetical protein